MKVGLGHLEDSVVSYNKGQSWQEDRAISSASPEEHGEAAAAS